MYLYFQVIIHGDGSQKNIISKIEVQIVDYARENFPITALTYCTQVYLTELYLIRKKIDFFPIGRFTSPDCNYWQYTGVCSYSNVLEWRYSLVLYLHSISIQKFQFENGNVSQRLNFHFLMYFVLYMTSKHLPVRSQLQKHQENV